MDEIRARIERIREWLTTHGLQALIVPSGDPHQSEYPPTRFQARAWASGFDGSAGTLVVHRESAGLWTDSRYFLHAERVLSGTGIDLFRQGESGVPDYSLWLARTLDRGESVAVDSRLVTSEQAERLMATLATHEVELVDAGDVMEEVWPDRPELPREPVSEYSAAYAGATRDERLAAVRTVMEEHGAASHVVSTLDDIAWLLNLRGSDVAYNPVFVAFLIVGPSEATLYTAPERLSDAVQTALRSSDVKVRPYEAFTEALADCPAPTLIDPQRTSWAVADALTDATRATPQPSTAMKARKNETQLANLRRAMVRDGQAMVRFLIYLERVSDGDARVDELHLAERLHNERARLELYQGDAFDTISGFGEHGAVVHYRVTPESALPVHSPGLYLVDSGGQYLDGTTDITRTVAIGEAPYEEAKVDFTLVLKAHIALATLVFPEGASGHELDAVPRAELWREGRSYGHGTGHGVGYFLNVHEGPQRITMGSPPYPLEPGMIISNEPGLYRTGRWGIRIENLVAVRHERETEFGRYLSFETLSLCPIDRRMIRTDLLTERERAWVDEYHRQVDSRLGGELEAVEREWLARACAPLD